jgi:uncharacterized GH25 family protein
MTTFWEITASNECCDTRVVELGPHQARTYASALVDTWDSLSERPRLHIPLRKAIESWGSLSKRIRMLTERPTNRLSVLNAVLVAAAITVPLAVAFAVEPEQTIKPGPKDERAGAGAVAAGAAILSGRVRNDEGAPLADVRVRVAVPAADMRFVNTTSDHRQFEARSDAKGEFRLEIPGLTERTTISVDAMKPGYRRLSGTMMTGGDARTVEVAPGNLAELAPLILEPAAYFAGIVVDEGGKPISGVKIGANLSFVRSTGGIERVASRADGSFELFNYPVDPRALMNEAARGYVSFFHPDHIDKNIADLYAIAPKERSTLRIVLTTGRKVTGTVLDVAGKPVPGAMIKVTRKDGSHRKATMTDANGKFILRGLSAGLTSLTARAMAIKQTIVVPMALSSDKTDLLIRLKKMDLPAAIKSQAVLGMQLADVTPELESAYGLFQRRGALILDPGKNSDRLGIGPLAEGYHFWMVGQRRIGSVREFVNQILAETAGRNADLHSVRVVFGFSTVEFDGNNTQYLKLTRDDLKELQTVSDQLADE